MAAEGVSIIYTTYRREPRFDWFADSLARQIGGDEVEAIFVDALHCTERAATIEQVVRGRFPFLHVAPMPTPYSGPDRLTSRDLFTAASARNTGIVHASHPFVAFVDDCSVLTPGWWHEVSEAAGAGYVIAGAYEKAWEMVVDAGRLLSRRVAAGRDTRWHVGSDDGRTKMIGGQLYGCSFAAPRQLLLDLNGFDELCDPIGSEDYHLGIRLEWSGAPLFYSRSMLTVESEELATEGEPRPRLGLAAASEDYLATLRTFGVEHRSTDGSWDNSHMVLDILYGTRELRSLDNYYELSTIEPGDLGALPAEFPSTYWFDGRLLAGL